MAQAETQRGTLSIMTHGALCLLWHTVHFIIYGKTPLPFQEYLEFMRTARWKITRGENGCRNKGTTWKYEYVFGDTVGTWRLSYDE